MVLSRNVYKQSGLLVTSFPGCLLLCRLLRLIYRGCLPFFVEGRDKEGNIMMVLNKRNNKGKYYDRLICAICGVSFDWMEEDNAILMVKQISIDDKKRYLETDVVAKCPNCGYRYLYLYRILDKQYK